ncbi:hypothetical protein J2125_004743 [Erwinia toletana]|uniref:Uncharacterized protein n=1 Tax=Winslowiella toletana TaxID=92490 RepID=A0ABS4PHG7_9GAMM|nr:hypothetical protein [Winslowiella toletana]MBP2171551.1 hypothetical protein [Winslowiella toletana]
MHQEQIVVSEFTGSPLTSAMDGYAVYGTDCGEYQQVLKCSLVALSSIAAIGRGAVHPTSMSEIGKLNDFLGKWTTRVGISQYRGKRPTPT